MKNKIFVKLADFHFDLQRFADAVTYLDANGTEQSVSDTQSLTAPKLRSMTAGISSIPTSQSTIHSISAAKCI